MRLLLETVWEEDELLAEIERVKTLISPHLLVKENFFEERFIIIKDKIETARAKIETSLEADPAWENELPESFCLEEGGTIQSTFSAPHTDFPPSNILGAMGNADFSLVLRGETIAFSHMTAVSGARDNGDSRQIAISIAGFLDNTDVIIAFLFVDPDLFEANTTLEVNAYDVQGYLTVLPEGRLSGFTILGFIKGTLSIGDATLGEGGLIEGSFDGVIINREYL